MPQIAASIEVLLVGTRKGGSEMPSAGPQKMSRPAAGAQARSRKVLVRLSARTIGS